MEEAFRRRCRRSRARLWKLLLTTVLLGASPAFSQQTEVEITPENADRFPRFLQRAEPGITFILATDLELASTVSVRSLNVTIQGNSQAARPVVRCTEGVNGAFRVRSDGIVFTHLEIRGCRDTAVFVSSVEENPDPFAQQGSTDPEPLNVNFQNVYFVNNSGSQERDSAGAIFIGRRVTAKIVRCNFENNTGSRGGAIRSLGTSLQINNSVFSNNTAVNSGGAISGDAHHEDRGDQEQRSELSIRSTRFLHNRVREGDQDPNPLTLRSSSVNVEANQYLKFPRPTSSGGALNFEGFTSVTIMDSEFEGNSAVPAGGAIYLSDSGDTVIQNCTFRYNFVSPVAQQRENAEGLQVGGAIFVAFQGPSRGLNILVSRFVGNRAVYGGALHVVAPVSSSINVIGSNFTDNRAGLGGGAIVFRNVNSPQLSGCRFVRNSAFVGGAVFMTNGAGLQVFQGFRQPRPKFTDNIALDGGAVFGIGAGTVQLDNAELVRNQAYRHGGALCLVDSRAGSDFLLQDARVRSNTAEIGGALFLENMERVELSASNNAEDRNQLLIQERSVGVNTFSSNAAVAGGAIYYKASNSVRNEVEFARSRFVNNKVYSNLSAIYPEPIDYPGRDEDVSTELGRRLLQDSKNEGSANESLLDPLGAEPCYPGGGGAICFVLTGLSERVPVSIALFDSNFENNSASVGGGLFLSTEAGVDWAPKCRRVNRFTSALLVNDPCRLLRLRNLAFVGNLARLAGGGLFVSNLSHVYYSAAESEASRGLYLSLVESSYTKELASNNSVDGGGYGPNIASMAVSLRIKNVVPDAETGFLIRNHSSGQSNPLPPISIEILDEMSQVVSAGITDSTLRIRATAESYTNGNSIVAGQIDAVAEAGVARFSALSISAPAGTYEVVFEPSIQSVKSVVITVDIRACLLGEVNDTESFICKMCEVESFSLDTSNTKCDDCVAHARCGGGASIVPLPNYWHSSLFSTVMLECLNNKACRYENRTSRLEQQHNISRQDFFERLENKGNDLVFTNEEYSQCADGYEGPLCGSCADGYGRTDRNTCRECGNKGITSVVVFGITIWQLFLVGITLRSALVSIKDMNQMMVFVGNSSTSFAPPSVAPVSTVTNAGAQGLAHLRDILNDPKNARMTPEELHEIYEEFREQIISTQVVRVPPNPATAARQKMSFEYITAVQHMSETVKIFVNFLQMTSVAISINVDWTDAVREMLATMQSAAGLSSGASFTPLTCLLDDDTNHRSIYGEILKFSIPLGIILLFMIYYSIRWFVMLRKPYARRDQCMEFFRSRAIISFLVVMFFSYQSLSEDFMGMVSCIELDSDEIDNDTLYPQYSIARDWYWTEDTNIKCFEHRHALLAIIIGIPGIVFFLFGVPLCLLVFLLYKRAKEQLLELNMVNTYGFIYQNYRETFVFWEVCILARKALIGAVVVFAYPLGSNLQGVMALGVLILALSIHLTAAPFKYDILNVFEGCSLLVSIFTFYSGIVFNDENTTHAGSVFLSTILVFVIVVLVIVFLVSVFHFGDKYMTAKLKFIGIQDIPENLILRFFKLADVLSEQALTSIRDTIRNRLLGSRAQANGNQVAARSRTADSYQVLGSQVHAQYSDVIQDENDQNEITVEMTEDRSNE